MNTSKMHRGPTTRTAGRSKHLDSCARPGQDMPAPTRASLAKEMHVPRLGDDACIPCMLQLTVSRPPNRTWINHYSIQVFQSAQEKVPGTQPINPSAQNRRDARISQAKRCTRLVHRRHDACISWLTKMHAYLILHAPVGVILACCHQIRLQLGGSIPLRTNAGG